MAPALAVVAEETSVEPARTISSRQTTISRHLTAPNSCASWASSPCFACIRTINERVLIAKLRDQL